MALISISVVLTSRFYVTVLALMSVSLPLALVKTAVKSANLFVYSELACEVGTYSFCILLFLPNLFSPAHQSVHRCPEPCFETVALNHIRCVCSVKWWRVVSRMGLVNAPWIKPINVKTHDNMLQVLVVNVDTFFSLLPLTTWKTHERNVAFTTFGLCKHQPLWSSQHWSDFQADTEPLIVICSSEPVRIFFAIT